MGKTFPLHRIIQQHKTHPKENRPNSDSFHLNRGEIGISVYDGTNLSAQQAYQHWTQVLQLPATGVVTVTTKDCQALSIAIRPDPKPNFPQHTLLIPPEAESHSQRNSLLRRLHRKAKKTWSYQPLQT